MDTLRLQLRRPAAGPAKYGRCLGAALLLLCLRAEAPASYGIYVGKNLTADGSVFLAGYGDEPSSHWLHIEPAREHRQGDTIQVGATSEARYPGRLIEIPQVGRTTNSTC